MVKDFKSKYLVCDKCNKPLENRNWSTIFEDTKEHLEEVARSNGWIINESEHICKECSK